MEFKRTNYISSYTDDQDQPGIITSVHYAHSYHEGLVEIWASDDRYAVRLGEFHPSMLATWGHRLIGRPLHDAVDAVEKWYAELGVQRVS